MYDYLDQPLARFAIGSKLLVCVTRAWARARITGECPLQAVAPALRRCGAGAALPAIHRLLTLIEGDIPGTTLDLPAPDAPRIDDLEAVLLRLWSDALDAPGRARATLTLMLGRDGDEDETSIAAFEALTVAATRLAQCGLPPIGLTVHA